MGRTRRFVLASLATTGALTLGWSLLPPRQRLVTARPLPLVLGQTALNGWVKIGIDNSVTVIISKSEMGQGVITSLAMLLAEELDADWPQVRTESAPTDKIYGNLAVGVDSLPFHPDDESGIKRASAWMTAKLMRELGIMFTGASSSIKDLWLPMREAGASARAMLVAAAAAQWQVPPQQIEVYRGRLSHTSGKRASFGELAERAAQQPIPNTVSLKQRKDFYLIGQSIKRLEAASKLDGSARFGIDVLPPGLTYAAVTMCPTLGGTLAGMDAGAAAAMPGVKKLIALAPSHGASGAVAVIADLPHRAQRALERVQPRWHDGALAGFNSAEMIERCARALDTEDGFAFHRAGDVDAAIKSAAKVIRAEYRAPYLAHATMEPMNCTVAVRDGGATVWASTQVPSLARDAVARVLGLAPERVDVQVQLLGGGFGRRLEVDFIAQAAQIAAAMPGTPVQTIWSREQDMRHDFYRPAAVSRFEAGFDAQGRLLAWRNTSAGQTITAQWIQRVLGLPMVGPDKTSDEGAFDQPYEWPNARIAHQRIDAPLPVGLWRSVGHSHQAFFKESFVDEAAHACGRDPVQFRSELLQRHPRHRAVLQRCADLAGWGQALPNARDGAKKARGIALHQSFGSIVAQVAEVSLAADKTIRVHRVVCVIDCGLAVNPGMIRQQMESGVVFGLSAALYGGVDIDKGQVRQSNFHDQPMLRMAECPAIETDIIASDAHPEGAGEPGTPPIAPALANALFALTGQRLRSLPLKLA